MKKKYIYFIVLLLLPVQMLVAQNNAQAVKIIDGLIQTAKNNTLKADFNLSVFDIDGDITQSQKGVLTLKNDFFRLKMDEMDIIFNGKTQWSYVKASNEVTITEPSKDELGQINPIAVISNYRDDCIIIFSRQEQSAENYIVLMIPTTPGAEFESINVYVNKKTNNLSTLKMKSTSDYSVKIDFSSFQKGVAMPDNAFVFNKNNYPEVFVNDLR